MAGGLLAAPAVCRDPGAASLAGSSASAWPRRLCGRRMADGSGDAGGISRRWAERLLMGWGLHRARRPVITRAAMRSGVRQTMATFKELVFSGVQPTGNLHLGNYLGRHQALRDACRRPMTASIAWSTCTRSPCRQDPDDLTPRDPRSHRGLSRGRHRPEAQHRVQPEPGLAARRARLGVQLRRPPRLAQPHDPVQGQGRQGPRERLGRALCLSDADGGRHPGSIGRRMCRSARTRSSIWNWPATSRRNSTTTSPRRSPSTASATRFFPLTEPMIAGPGDARHVAARRHEEDVEIGRLRLFAHQPHRRCRHDRPEDPQGARPTPSRCPPRSRA